MDAVTWDSGGDAETWDWGDDGTWDSGTRGCGTHLQVLVVKRMVLCWRVCQHTSS